jgi:hypothetical protein
MAVVPVMFVINSLFLTALCSRGLSAEGNTSIYRRADFSSFIIPVYLQSVQVHSVNWLKEVDECLGEGCSLALFYN